MKLESESVVSMVMVNWYNKIKPSFVLTFVRPVVVVWYGVALQPRECRKCCWLQNSTGKRLYSALLISGHCFSLKITQKTHNFPVMYGVSLLGLNSNQSFIFSWQYYDHAMLYWTTVYVDSTMLSIQPSVKWTAHKLFIEIVKSIHHRKIHVILKQWLSQWLFRFVKNAFHM